MAPHLPRSQSLPAEPSPSPCSEYENTQATGVIDLTHDTDDDDEISKTVEIDPRGDLKLIVGNKKVCFLVCSRALSRSARLWGTMLYGPFAEAKPIDGSEWKVKLPEDHAEAFEVLMNLVHWPGQPEKLPEISLQLAFEITVLTNKYLMTHCLNQCAQDWIADLVKDKSGEENLSWAPPIQWLWIIRELGDVLRYQKAFKQVALHCQSHLWDDGVPLLERLYLGSVELNPIGWEASLSTAGAAVLGPLVEEVLLARETAIERVKAPARKDLRDLTEATKLNYPSTTGPLPLALATPPRCQATAATYMEKCQCDLTMLGSAVTYDDDEFWPPNGRADEEDSPADYYHQTAVFTARECVRKAVKVLGKRHKRCTIFKSGFPTLDELEELVEEMAVSNGTLQYIHQRGVLTGLRREVIKQPSRKHLHSQMADEEFDEE